MGKGGSLFGAQGQLVHGARGALHSKAVQQGMLEADGEGWVRRMLPGAGVCGSLRSLTKKQIGVGPSCFCHSNDQLLLHREVRMKKT